MAKPLQDAATQESAKRVKYDKLSYISRVELMS